jgi:hypothetical protein
MADAIFGLFLDIPSLSAVGYYQGNSLSEVHCTMPRKVSKAKSKVQRTPPPGTQEHAAWRAKVSEGMRRAKVRRRKAGLLTLMQIAVKYELPLGFVRRKVDAGELQALKSGRRRYVRSGEAARAFGATA